MFQQQLLALEVGRIFWVFLFILLTDQDYFMNISVFSVQLLSMMCQRWPVAFTGIQFLHACELYCVLIIGMECQISIYNLFITKVRSGRWWWWSPIPVNSRVCFKLNCSSPVCAVKVFDCYQPKSSISVDYNMLRFSVDNVIVSCRLRSCVKNSLIHWLSVGMCNLGALR